MTNTDMARPDGPGSRPADQAPAGLDAPRIDPSRVASLWQCAETAPDDGSEFDAWTAHGERYTNVRWSSRRKRWEVWGMDGFDRMDWVRVDSRITHWMPIPHGPEGAQ